MDLLPNIKPGIKLPKSNNQWKVADDYFVGSMRISGIDNTDMELMIETINSNVYTYFQENYGLLDDSSLSLIMKSKSALKIKYAAKCLRSKLQLPNQANQNF